MSRLSLFLVRIASLRNLALLFALTLLFAALVFPWLRARVAAYGGESRSLDARFAYTAEQAYRAIEGYGQQGRAIYALGEATLDVAFPVVYTLFLGTWITCTFQRGFPGDSLVQRLHLFPFGLMAFDLLENAGIIVLLLSFPGRLNGLANLVSTFTTIKWLLALISTGLGVAGTAAAVRRRMAQA